MIKCPTCGGRLEATVPIYLEDVVITDGTITSFKLAFDWDAEGPFAWDAGARVYCENDHEIEWDRISYRPKLVIA